MGRRFPTTLSSSGRTPMVISLLASGSSLTRPEAITSASDRACSTVTPGFSRPITRQPRYPRATMIAPGPAGRSLSSAVVIQTCVGCGWIGNLNPAGMTPTMMKRELLRSTARPTMPASPPNCSCHTSKLRIAGRPPGPPPAASSSGRNARPSTGCTPRRGNRSAVITVPRSSCASRSPVSVRLRL